MPAKLELEAELVCKEYDEGSRSIREVARIFGVSVRTIKRVLYEQGVDIPPKWVDLTNRPYGILTAKEIVGHNEYGTVIWRCECQCGQSINVLSSNLVNKTTFDCGCGRGNNNNGSKVTNRNKSEPRKHPQIPLVYLKSLERGAKGRNLTFNLEPDFLWDLFVSQGGKCALSGQDIYFATTPFGLDRGEQTASLDRVDSSRGYEEDNVQWVHKEINWIKSNIPQKEFIRMCRLVAEYRAGD